MQLVLIIFGSGEVCDETLALRLKSVEMPTKLPRSIYEPREATKSVRWSQSQGSSLRSSNGSSLFHRAFS
jgi:hypothetical protein